MAAIVCDGLRRDGRCGLGLGLDLCFCVDQWQRDGNGGTVYVLDLPMRQYTEGTMYNYGLSAKPNYPVPAIPITVEWEAFGVGYPDATVYLDMWIGIDPCTHREWCTKM